MRPQRLCVGDGQAEWRSLCAWGYRGDPQVIPEAAPPSEAGLPVSQYPPPPPSLVLSPSWDPSHFKGPCWSNPFLHPWGASRGLLRSQGRASGATAPAPLCTPSPSTVTALGAPLPPDPRQGRHPDSAQGPRTRSLCVRPSPQRPLSPTEELFNQEEKVCWEEWLTKVGRGPTGLCGGRGGGAAASAPGWTGTCSAAGGPGQGLDHSHGLVPGGRGV